MDWLWNKFIENGRDFVEVSGPSQGLLMDWVNGISLIAIIIGFFFIIAGCKKIGTKITSITFIIYILIKACGVYV